MAQSQLNLASKLKEKFDSLFDILLKPSKLRREPPQDHEKTAEIESRTVRVEDLFEKTGTLIQNSIERCDKMLCAVQAFIKKGFQPALRFIADDVESDIQETLNFHSKRIGMLQRKVTLLAAAIRGQASGGARIVASQKHVGVQVEASRWSSRDLVKLFTIEVKGVEKTYTPVRGKDYERSLSAESSLEMESEKLREKQNLIDIGSFQLDLSESIKQVDDCQAKAVLFQLSEVNLAAEKVAELMQKFKKFAADKEFLREPDTKMQGLANLVVFQSEKLGRQLDDLLEALSCLGQG